MAKVLDEEFCIFKGNITIPSNFVKYGWFTYRRQNERSAYALPLDTHTTIQPIPPMHPYLTEMGERLKGAGERLKGAGEWSEKYLVVNYNLQGKEG